MTALEKEEAITLYVLLKIRAKLYKDKNNANNDINQLLDIEKRIQKIQHNIDKIVTEIDYTTK